MKSELFGNIPDFCCAYLIIKSIFILEMDIYVRIL